MLNEYRLKKCKECEVPYSVVPVDIAEYTTALHEINLIKAFLIDEGYMDTAKRLDCLTRIMNKLLTNYKYFKYDYIDLEVMSNDSKSGNSRTE